MGTLARIVQMDAAEFAWRTRTTARTALDRAAAAVRPSSWNRRRLARALQDSFVLEPARKALRRGRWNDAHIALSEHFQSAEPRFPIVASSRATLAARIRAEFPGAADDASSRAGRIIAGEYDLLGYRGLRFGTPLPDWHLDPVHSRRPPLAFWSAVPFLDPLCGDHKIIWELNRHQHWLALGRAYWLANRDDARARFIAELESWMSENPPLAGINWASMLELAFRCLSWLWAIHFFTDPAAHDDEPWLVDLLLGLDRQLTQVERHLSYYFSPNTHLLGEALALYVAGRALPELAASDRRAALGRHILIDEIARQIAPDGGHCERSAHYHRYTLDFYSLALIVARLTNDAAAAGHFERATARLAFAARVLADDSGRLPHLGDDDGGALFPIAGRPVDDIADSLAVAAALVNRPDLQIGPAPEEAMWVLQSRPDVAAPDRVASTALPDTGYYISRSDGAIHVVIDAGPHGYQNGGHAHADALSLTLTVRRLPLVTDPGTGCYTVDTAVRDRLRSSQLHNTVTIDNEPQSLPRGPFHWARVANGQAHRWRTNDGFDFFDGSHDGYAARVHRRRVLVLHSDAVVVADFIDGDGIHDADAHWHLDARWAVRVDGSRAVCRAEGEQVVMWTAHGNWSAFSGDSDSGLGWQSPVYGVVEPATTLRTAYHGNTPAWIATVFDVSEAGAVQNVESIPVWSRAGTLAHGFGLRITRSAGVDLVLFAEPTQGMDGDATWRIGDLETDARMLFCRFASDASLTRLAMVDGSLVRRNGGRRLHLALPRPVPDFHLDLNGEPRAAGPAFGARLILGGVEQPLDVDRRATPRT